MRSYLLSVVMLVGGVAAYPVDAAACDCATGERWLLLPEPGATDVPTNTLLWTGATYLTLEDADGAEVELDARRVRVSQGWAHSYRPANELRPFTRYIMHGPDFDVSFETGAGPDSTPPAVPSMTVTGSIVWLEDGSTCGEWLFVTAKPVHEGAFVVVDADVPDDFDPIAWSGRADDVFAGEELLLGRSDCVNNIPFAQLGSAWDVRLLSIDLAGNVSEWSSNHAIHFPEEDPNANGTGGSPVGGGGGQSMGSGGQGGGGAGVGGSGVSVSKPTRPSSGCGSANSPPSPLVIALAILAFLKANRGRTTSSQRCV